MNYILIDYVPEINEIFQLFISVLVERKTFDKKLFCIFTKVVKYWSITKADRSYFPFKVNLNFSNMFPNLLDNSTMTVHDIFELYIKSIADNDDIDNIFNLFYQFIMIVFKYF